MTKCDHPIEKIILHRGEEGGTSDAVELLKISGMCLDCNQRITVEYKIDTINTNEM